MSEIRDWFMTVPPITRAWFGLSVALPLLGRIGLLNPYYMILTSRAWTGLEVCCYWISMAKGLMFRSSYGDPLRPHSSTQ